jgi:hypothetical protein
MTLTAAKGQATVQVATFGAARKRRGLLSETESLQVDLEPPALPFLAAKDAANRKREGADHKWNTE